MFNSQQSSRWKTSVHRFDAVRDCRAANGRSGVARPQSVVIDSVRSKPKPKSMTAFNLDHEVSEANDVIRVLRQVRHIIAVGIAVKVPRTVGVRVGAEVVGLGESKVTVPIGPRVGAKVGIASRVALTSRVAVPIDDVVIVVHTAHLAIRTEGTRLRPRRHIRQHSCRRPQRPRSRRPPL